MPRTKKKLSLEEQIKAAQEKVIKTKEPYNRAIAELSALLDQRAKSREEELLEAYASSKRSFDEIMQFIRSDPEEDWY
ncbi:MAG: hypothetical protein IJR00_12820 [Lachnospiraceae bacterium]|nr:hypothetical protein [Lachnospiraceae bacterium]